MDLDELKMLDAGSWFNERYPERANRDFARQSILTLAELVTIAEAAKPPPGLYLEVKNPEKFPGIEQELIVLLRGRGWIRPSQPDEGTAIVPGDGTFTKSPVILQSFSLDSIAEFERLAPNVPRVYLVQDQAESEEWKTVIAQAKRYGAGSGLSGHDVSLLRSAQIHREGLYLHVYTINETKHFRILNWLGADGFFTDRPDRLLRFYDPARRWSEDYSASKEESELESVC